MTAKVTVNGTTVVVSISDLTTGKSVTKTLHMAGPDTSSAEWVAEAPSVETGDGNYQVVPLADFGKVTFTSATATTTGGHTGSISDSAWTSRRVVLVSSDGGFDGLHRGGPGMGRRERAVLARLDQIGADQGVEQCVLLDVVDVPVDVVVGPAAAEDAAVRVVVERAHRGVSKS